jgi:DNA-binding response OmpR family regulator
VETKLARILCIDDEPTIRSVVRRALTGAGHQVEEAEDGEVGVSLFEASEFDLVICDLIMPKKEGIQTILEIREQAPSVPILAVSGGLEFGGEAIDRFGPLVDAKALGADAALEKPFDVRELLETVDSLLVPDSPEE